MFIGRQAELDTLKEHYRSSSFEFIGIYGRRRVGKTTLINEFTRDLPTVFFTGIEDSEDANLRALSQATYLFSNPDADPLGAPAYPDFPSAIEAAFALGSKERVVLVIDEFPYLAKADPSVPSILQTAIDRAIAQGSKLFLILCGSSLSFMKGQLLDRKSPLYGRRTAQIELKPFDYFDSLAFFPEAERETAAQLYAMAGGIPLYMEQFSPGKTLEENITDAFLDPASILYEEPANLLKQEVSKASRYNSVLDAIASGKSKLNEIATTAHLQTSEASYYLSELRRIGLVEKESPIVNPGKRAMYRISDGLFAFWYRFVNPYRSLIEHGRGNLVARRIAEGLPDFMGQVFETICRSWLWRTLGTDMPATVDNGVLFTKLGRWWGPDPATHQQEEIDVVGTEGPSVVLVGECKWRNQPVRADVLKKLYARSALVGATQTAQHLVFAKATFTEGCEEFARELPQARLVTFEQMVQTVCG